MIDFRATGTDFNSTSVTVDAISAAAKAVFAEKIGAGAVSVQMPKSQFGNFEAFVTQRGLTI